MTYERLTADLRRVVREALPAGARVLVVSRGDDRLVRLEGMRAGHFPQSPTGQYAGYHPADGAEAVRHLQELRDAGARYLVLPATASWWLEHYGELRAFLDECRLVADDPGSCRVYDLAPPAVAVPATTRDELEAARVAPQAAGVVSALLPPDAGVVLVGRAAPLVDVGDRPCWRIGTPSGEGLADRAAVADRVEQARAAGAGFLVLVHPDRPSDAFDARLRRGLVAGRQRLMGQRLVECFALGAQEAAGG